MYFTYFFAKINKKVTLAGKEGAFVKLKITDISSHAAGIIQTSVCGVIHSVYRHTINIKTDSSLIALQSPGSVLSPISLIADCTLDSPAISGISQGLSVCLSKDAIRIMTPDLLTFSLKETVHHDSLLSVHLGEREIEALSRRISHALEATDSQGLHWLFLSQNTVGGLSPVLSAVQKCLNACSRQLSLKAYDQAAAEAVRLTGLGIGLTPSGDDFLCGMLAGLQLLSYKAHPFSAALRREIAFHLSDTNDISAAFLSCALKNLYSQPVLALSSMEASSRIYKEFSRIGHSSGIDTLSGIYYILTQRHLLVS